MRPEPEDEPLELNDVLEPYDAPASDAYEQPYYPAGEPYEEEADAYGDPYDDEYSDEHEALDAETRLHATVNLLNAGSVLLGVFVVFLLLAMLLGLFSWLQNDIAHSLILLESGVR